MIPLLVLYDSWSIVGMSTCLRPRKLPRQWCSAYNSSCTVRSVRQRSQLRSELNPVIPMRLNCSLSVISIFPAQTLIPPERQKACSTSQNAHGHGQMGMGNDRGAVMRLVKEVQDFAPAGDALSAKIAIQNSLSIIAVKGSRTLRRLRFNAHHRSLSTVRVDPPQTRRIL